ncbi:uncharacterized protein DSM5745_04193 [Aspergillus mulundensis]|uniref:Uncharacterized protein n=1 Tax=Aspergillus mulundensis TaxID=1810919 RepID=A0A3D8SBZ1_9EURO|nr:Uncharacterized protein DSM5745_04193 [Aspergillus mulundensis]RDW83867.1 Uncharacterized protein DSM5745_04193 [Aspergillus mulundensis]
MASTSHSQRATVPKSCYGEGLQLRALNVEKGPSRYPSYVFCYGWLLQKLIETTERMMSILLGPPTGATALSQRRNLLFVACSHQIYVWEPAGASQTLGNKPEMIIAPVMKEPQAGGYIRPTSPHEINSLLVDDLGREEVLLLVTDSGNVCGYRVEAIYSALKRAADNGKTRPLDGAEIDPFFIEYVGASAWGLAIHKFARLIAVSANTGDVTVFAFALVSPESDKVDDSFRQLEEVDNTNEYSQTWLHIRTAQQFRKLQQLMPKKHRTRNIKLTYSGHFTNIPSVGFLNTDFDPNGMWMVSTDIFNRTIVWKIWETLGPFNDYHLNNVAPWSIPEDAYLDDGDRGWSVIALDPRSFHLVKTEEEACGGRPRRRIKNKHEILDLTNLTKNLPDSSRLYNHFPPAVKAKPDETVLPDFFGADCLISGNNVQGNNETEKLQPSVTDDLRQFDSAESTGPQAVDGSFNADEMSEGSASGSASDTEPQQPTGNRALLRALANHPNHVLSPESVLEIALRETAGIDINEVQALLSDDDDDNSQLEMEVDSSDNGGDAYEEDTAPQEDDFYRQFSKPPPNADFPILHFSHTNITLISDPFSLHPSVVHGAPLLQRFLHPIGPIRGFDRLNMIKYIPEHGIVVAASQKGRAAIIALTESAATGRTFRVDWIVPLESQEKYGERPLLPLLGVAVAPMQGFEIPHDVPFIPRGADANGVDDENEGDTDTETSVDDLLFQYKSTTGSTSAIEGIQDHPTLPESHARATRAYQPEERWRGWNPSRRYRLLLVYADHSVLSYEFWYTWNASRERAGAVDRSDDGDGDGAGNVGESEDDYLIL